MGVLNIGASALNAAYTQLQTTSHNIANAQTPGYSRQETVLQASSAQFTGGMFVGGGVEAVDVRRAYNAMLTGEVNAATAARSESGARAQAMTRLESFFNDRESGIGVLHDELRQALADIVNQPFDPAARTVALARANTFAERVTDTDRALDSLRNDADLELRQNVRSLNDELAELADVNRRIATQQGSQASPNDLLDQRDALVEGINARMKANAHINTDGTVTLFAATGDALVIGEDAMRISVTSDTLDMERLRLSIATGDEPVVLNDRMLAGGAIAGLLAFRNQDITMARSQLGRYAAAVGSAYNEQQRLGLDLNGDAGRDLFSIAAARTVASTDNTGTADFAIAIDDATALKASDYELVYDGSDFTLTRQSDGVQRTFASLPQTVDGLEIAVASGAVAAGDRYTLKTASAYAAGFEMALGSPREWAAAYASAPVLGQGNTGSLTVGDFAVRGNDPNLAADVSIVFTGPNSFDVTGTGTGNPTGVAYTPGGKISFNGWEIELNGTPAAGDRVDLSAIGDSLADNRNARRLLDVGDSRMVDGQTAAEAFGAVLGEIGSHVFSVNTDLHQSEIWQTNATAARDEVSGVNLDEEAARLIQYQQAYQAAAKVIAAAQNMFDSIVSIMN
ncbi:MAG: flagellar hook-associated protein FlgK [Burkholderiaceae bacterium]